jgi:hypothetical protein
MMTLRDTQSSKTIQVPPTGVVLGREGGDADILVRDKSVSKHHARLYEQDGEWWLEDLNSANGTFVDDQRIAGPVPVAPGIAFSLSNYQFEVVKIAGGGGASAGGGDVDQAGPRTRVGKNPEMDDDGFAEPTAPPPQGRNGGGGGGARGNAARAPAAPARNVPQPVRQKAEPTNKPSRKSAPKPEIDSDFDEPQLDIAEKKGFGEVMLALPKAVAYYMGAVPLMLLNPLGSIRKGIEDQRFDGMKTMELIAWSFPGQLAGAAFSLICSFIVVIVTAIRGGGFAIGALITAIIVAPIVAVVGSLIVGFLLHPVLGWIIRFLKGESDDKSRTNYMIMGVTAGVLMNIPAGLLVLISAFSSLLPGALARVGALLPILPMVIQLAATLIMVFLAYSWFTFFNVVKWFRILILVGGVLACVGTVLNIFHAVMYAISGGGGTTIGSTSTGGMPTLTAEQLAAMTPEQREAYAKSLAFAASHTTTTMGTLTSEQLAAMTPEAREAYAKSLAAAASHTTTVPKSTPTTAATASNPKATPAETPEEGGDDASTHPGGTNHTTVAVNTTTTNPGNTTSTPHDAGGGSAYTKFASKREAIEKAILEDPTILNRDSQTFALYKNLHLAILEARKKNAPRAGGDEILLQRLIEAELFEKQARLVDDLYARVHR